jgi:hypothetical protein
MDRLMDRRRSGRTGILHPCGRFEAQVWVALEDKRSGEVLGREAGIEVPEQDGVYLGCAQASIGHRPSRGFDDHALQCSVTQPAKWEV